MCPIQFSRIALCVAVMLCLLFSDFLHELAFCIRSVLVPVLSTLLSPTSIPIYIYMHDRFVDLTNNTLNAHNVRSVAQLTHYNSIKTINLSMCHFHFEPERFFFSMSFCVSHSCHLCSVLSLSRILLILYIRLVIMRKEHIRVNRSMVITQHCTSTHTFATLPFRILLYVSG